LETKVLHSDFLCGKYCKKYFTENSITKIKVDDKKIQRKISAPYFQQKKIKLKRLFYLDNESVIVVGVILELTHKKTFFSKTIF
jgi:hypothetical protein